MAAHDIGRFDLKIEHGFVVSGSSVQRADVGIAHGRVGAVGDLGGSPANDTIDAEGMYVLPGLIDVHNHPVYADDLGSMSNAALAGGFTTVVPFIGALPAWGNQLGSTSELIGRFIETWNGSTGCDFAVHAAITGADDLGAEIDALIGLGVFSFKFFMAYRRRGMMVDDSQLLENLAAVGRRGGIAIIHAENGATIEFLEEAAKRSSKTDSRSFLPTHTSLSEAEAILRAISLADAARCTVYIAHVSVGEALPIVSLARRIAKLPIYLETCPHYLLLTDAEVERRGALAKIAPPLRTVDDNMALWDGLKTGRVDVIATDHAPHPLSEKLDALSILDAPYGAESIEHALPLIYSAGVTSGKIEMTELVRAMAERPAQIFGLAPSKGRVAVGADADLVIFDPTGRTRCSAESHFSRADYCLYEGRECNGSIRLTMRRGVIAFEDGRIMAQAGGQYVSRGSAGLSQVSRRVDA